MGNKKSSSEKRKNERAAFETQVVIKGVDGIKIQAKGSSKDLSLKGIFVTTDKEIAIGSECEIEVILTGMIEDVVLKMNGKVMRKEKTGVGVHFESIDLESYTHLKNIVMYNA